MSRLCYSPQTAQARRVKHATHLPQNLYQITLPATYPWHICHGHVSRLPTDAQHTCPPSECPHNTAQPFTLLAYVTPPHYALATWPCRTQPATHLFTPCASLSRHPSHGLCHTSTMSPTIPCTTMLLTTLAVPPPSSHHTSPSMP